MSYVLPVILVCQCIFLLGYFLFKKYIEAKSIITSLSGLIITTLIINIVFLSNIILLCIILILALIAIIICKKNRKKHPKNSKRIAIHIAIIILLATITMIPKSGLFGTSYKEIVNKEHQFAKSSALRLGEMMAKQCPPNSKALIITRRGDEKNNRKDIFIDALKEGFGDKITINSIELIDAGLPKDIPDGELMQAVNFDRVIDKHKQCNVIISTIGLPLNVEDMKIWKMKKDRPKVGLLNVYVKVLRNAIKADYISAAVAYNPKKVINDKIAPKDMKKAFDLRYLMITPDNIDKISNENPGLFY